ncbi:MAG: hydrogenase formation protein HypD [Methylohalobius sp.]|nr:hydrogenase formation protein HypD [Methylohalobius sp.]
MRFLSEFRDPSLANAWVRRIEAHLSGLQAPLPIMEFCGGHTHAIFRYGLHQILPSAIEWVHGPGCPVCVLPRAAIDLACTLAQDPAVILASFGDAVRVPGSSGSLLSAKAQGGDVRIVYSPLDALEIARRHPEREVVFLAIGFETTQPATALTILQAEREGIANFSVLCRHVITEAAIRAVLADPDVRLAGVIAPGHVATVLGANAFAFIPKEYRIPTVVSGFEPLDLLQALCLLLGQLAAGRCALDNQYRRSVRPQGNLAAQKAIAQVFEPIGSAEWRGLGRLPASGVRIKERYGRFDAERRFGVTAQTVEEEPLPCSQVLCGKLKPKACPYFGTRCHPEQPLGALMVSSEGACAAWYRYQGE